CAGKPSHGSWTAPVRPTYTRVTKTGSITRDGGYTPTPPTGPVIRVLRDPDPGQPGLEWQRTCLRPGERQCPSASGDLAEWPDALRWQSAARPGRLHLRSHARPAAQRDPHRIRGHGVERPPALVGSVRRHPALDVAGPAGLQHVRRWGAGALPVA